MVVTRLPRYRLRSCLICRNAGNYTHWVVEVKPHATAMWKYAEDNTRYGLGRCLDGKRPRYTYEEMLARVIKWGDASRRQAKELENAPQS